MADEAKQNWDVPRIALPDAVETVVSVSQPKHNVGVVEAALARYKGDRGSGVDLHRKQGLPTTREQVLANIGKISAKHSGGKGKVYTSDQIVEICKNLSLPHKGKKTDLVKLIRSHVGIEDGE